MFLAAKIISLFFILFGFVLILKHELILSIVEFFKKDKHIYFVAIFRILAGALFIAVSPQCRIRWFILASGIFLVIAGLITAVIKKEKAVMIMDRIFYGFSPLALKMIGTIPLLFGILLLRGL